MFQFSSLLRRYYILVSLCLLHNNNNKNHIGVHAVVVNPRSCGGATRHVHISVGPDPSSSMIVTFASIPSKFPAPIGGVLLGTTPYELDRVVMEEGPPSSYNLTAMSKKTANYGDLYFSPYYHHVTMEGLEPSTTYFYKPLVKHKRDDFNHLPSPHSDAESQVDGNEDEESHRNRRLINWPPYDGSDHDCPSPDKIHSFTTAPKTGPDAPVTFAIMGDLGQFPHSEELLARLERDRDELSLVVLAGDVSYTNEDHRRWDTFFDFLDDYPIFDHIPMQICPGNHDIDKLPDGKDIFLGYEHRFRMPRVHPPELGPFEGPVGPLNMDAPPYPLPYEWGNAYYSFSYGPARLIFINAYASMEPNSTQYKWIVDELSSVDRTKTPWLITVLHPPIYNTFSLHHHDLQMKAAKEHLEPIFVQHKVNLVFTGHIHAYLRTAAVVMEKLVPTGPIHITVGAGGRKCEAPFQSVEPEPWVQVRDATNYGYGMFRILNRTTAVWDWIHTGRTDNGRTYNEVGKSNATLPPGPSRDNVVISNQYYL